MKVHLLSFYFLSLFGTHSQIVVLSNGSVLEKGTHSELLAKQGTYANLWEMQAKAAEDQSRASEDAKAAAASEPSE